MSDYVPPKGFLRGIRFRHFMDTYKEWHAFVQGLCEVLCPWPPRHKEMSDTLAAEIVKEHTYYVWGRACGVPILLVMIGLFVKWVFC